jgi:hypothetical protein
VGFLDARLESSSNKRGVNNTQALSELLHNAWWVASYRNQVDNRPCYVVLTVLLALMLEPDFRFYLRYDDLHPSPKSQAHFKIESIESLYHQQSQNFPLKQWVALKFPPWSLALPAP